MPLEERSVANHGVKEAGPKRVSSGSQGTRRQQDARPRYCASTDPALAPFMPLMQQDSALVRTLHEALSKLSGVNVAVIFGSVARRAAGGKNRESERPRSVGGASELKVNATLKPVGLKLGRAVRATACAVDSFKNQLSGGESFALSVLQEPRVSLIGDLNAALFRHVRGELETRLKRLGFQQLSPVAECGKL